LSGTILPGKCLLTMVSRDSSGEVLSNPSGFLTSPSLFEGLDFRILDNFAIAGSVFTSLTNSWNLVLLEYFMHFLSDLLERLGLLSQLGRDDLAGMLFYTWFDTVSWHPHSLCSTSHSALSP
jgi:hypothetical protein